MGQINDSDSPAVVVVMGVSGCGKSTVGKALANQLDSHFLEADDLHPPGNIKKMSGGIALTDEDRDPWLKAVRQKTLSITESGKSCVVACSALKKIYRDLLRETPLTTYFVHLEGSRDVLMERMQTREGHFMPPGLLDSQLDTLQDPSGECGVVSVDIDQNPQTIVESARNQLVLLHKTDDQGFPEAIKNMSEKKT